MAIDNADNDNAVGFSADNDDIFRMKFGGRFSAIQFLNRTVYGPIIIIGYSQGEEASLVSVIK